MGKKCGYFDTGDAIRNVLLQETDKLQPGTKKIYILSPSHKKGTPKWKQKFKGKYFCKKNKRTFCVGLTKYGPCDKLSSTKPL
jgi:hypothetical protein